MIIYPLSCPAKMTKNTFSFGKRNYPPKTYQKSILSLQYKNEFTSNLNKRNRQKFFILVNGLEKSCSTPIGQRNFQSFINLIRKIPKAVNDNNYKNLVKEHLENCENAKSMNKEKYVNYETFVEACSEPSIATFISKHGLKALANPQNAVEILYFENAITQNLSENNKTNFINLLFDLSNKDVNFKDTSNFRKIIFFLTTNPDLINDKNYFKLIEENRNEIINFNDTSVLSYHIKLKQTLHEDIDLTYASRQDLKSMKNILTRLNMAIENYDQNYIYKNKIIHNIHPFHYLPTEKEKIKTINLINKALKREHRIISPKQQQTLNNIVQLAQQTGEIDFDNVKISLKQNYKTDNITQKSLIEEIEDICIEHNISKKSATNLFELLTDDGKSLLFNNYDNYFNLNSELKPILPQINEKIKNFLSVENLIISGDISDENKQTVKQIFMAIPELFLSINTNDDNKIKKVLKNVGFAVHNDNFKTLSDENKKMLIIAILLKNFEENENKPENFSEPAKASAQHAFEFLKQMQDLSFEQKTTICDLIYNQHYYSNVSEEKRNIQVTNTAFNLIANKNPDLLKMLAIINLADISLNNDKIKKEAQIKELERNITELNIKKKTISKTLKHLQRQFNFIPFPKKLQTDNKQIMKEMEQNEIYFEETINDKKIPIIHLGNMKKLTQDKQQEYFKALDFPPNTNMDNLNFLVHATSRSSNIDDLDKFLNQYKPDLILSSSNISRNQTSTFRPCGFILSDDTKPIRIYTEAAGTGYLKNRSMIYKYLEETMSMGKEELSKLCGKLHEKKENQLNQYSEIITADNGISGIFIKEYLYNQIKNAPNDDNVEYRPDIYYTLNKFVVDRLKLFAADNDMAIYILP